MNIRKFQINTPLLKLSGSLSQPPSAQQITAAPVLCLLTNACRWFSLRRRLLASNARMPVSLFHSQVVAMNVVPVCN